MPNSPSGSTGPFRDARFKVAGAAIVLAVVYFLVQRSRFAPFSHTADDFVGGLAVGIAIGCALLWFGGRRYGSAREPSNDR